MSNEEIVRRTWARLSVNPYEIEYGQTIRATPPIKPIVRGSLGDADPINEETDLIEFYTGQEGHGGHMYVFVEGRFKGESYRVWHGPM